MNELTKLPEGRWCVHLTTPEHVQVVGAWFDKYMGRTTPFYAKSPLGSNVQSWLTSNFGWGHPADAVEITLEQFKKWVLKEDLKLKGLKWYKRMDKVEPGLEKHWLLYVKGTIDGDNCVYTNRIDAGGKYWEKHQCNSCVSKGYVLADMNEIQQFLPEGHPDKFKKGNPFVVGKWYFGKSTFEWYFKYVEGNEEKVQFYEYLELKPTSYHKGQTLACLYNVTNIREVPLEEIQEWLPEGHEDKIVNIPAKWRIAVNVIPVEEFHAYLMLKYGEICTHIKNGDASYSYLYSEELKNIHYPEYIFAHVKENFTEITLEQFRQIIKQLKPIETMETVAQKIERLERELAELKVKTLQERKQELIDEAKRRGFVEGFELRRIMRDGKIKGYTGTIDKGSYFVNDDATYLSSHAATIYSQGVWSEIDPEEVVLPFGELEFTINKTEGTATCENGTITRGEIKEVLDWSVTGPRLLSYRACLHDDDYIHFGCQSGTVEEATNILAALED